MKLRKGGVIIDITNPNDLQKYKRLGWEPIPLETAKKEKSKVEQPASEPEEQSVEEPKAKTKTSVKAKAKKADE